jgi:hypothetical protein
VGKTDFIGRTTTDADVENARAMLASAESELPAIKQEAE